MKCGISISFIKNRKNISKKIELLIIFLKIIKKYYFSIKIFKGEKWKLQQ